MLRDSSGYTISLFKINLPDSFQNFFSYLEGSIYLLHVISISFRMSSFHQNRSPCLIPEDNPKKKLLLFTSHPNFLNFLNFLYSLTRFIVVITSTCYLFFTFISHLKYYVYNP